MDPLRNLSIRGKLSLLGTLSAALALVLACVMFVMNDTAATRAAMVQHLTTLADILGGNCVAALTFDDSKAANDVLASLRYEHMIRAARVFDREGRPFAGYEDRRASSTNLEPDLARQPGHAFMPDGTLQVVAVIHDDNEQVGTVVLKAGMEQVYARLRQQMITAVGVLALSILLSFVTASRLQKFVSVPITNLAGTAERISRNRDFSIRVKKVSDDEIGSLYTAFNRMLEQIAAGEAELQRSHDELERRVEDRTARLSEANEVLSREVAERKRAEAELRELQAEHIDAARRAGMAEIATSVLHNVGNVLNSVNVAAATIRERLKSSGVADLERVADLLDQHLADAGRFISEDARGKHLPRFLIQLSQKMAADEAIMATEIKALSESIEHINGIIALQQSYAGVSAAIEQLSLARLVEDALHMDSQSFLRNEIEVVREFEELPPAWMDKQKVLQILVNLISNAKHAVVSSVQPTRQVKVRIARTGAERVRVEVADNGIGIPAQNLTRIFSLGFTTRKDGHGFGLHSAANQAREMGGSLTASSPGLGQGATFTLDLPFRAARPQEPARAAR